MYRIGVSTVAFKEKKEAEAFYKETGIPLEYSVNLTEDAVSYLLKNGVECLSVHIPSPTRRFFPNFASSDPLVFQKSMEILKESMETLSKCGGNLLVLHPGYAVDALVPSDFKERKPFIEKGKEEFKEYVIEERAIATGRAYLLSSVYKRHFRIFMENIGEIVEYVKKEGFTLAVENLNPRLFYVLQLPDEVRRLSLAISDIRFCLDFGHLYISSLANEFDFVKGVREIIDTKKVVHLHISNNPSRWGYYDDAHDHISRGNIDFSTLFPLIPKEDVNFVLEVKYNPREDLELLKELLTK